MVDHQYLTAFNLDILNLILKNAPLSDTQRETLSTVTAQEGRMDPCLFLQFYEFYFDALDEDILHDAIDETDLPISDGMAEQMLREITITLRDHLAINYEQAHGHQMPRQGDIDLTPC